MMTRRVRTGDQALVRELNRSIVLERLWLDSPLSRADIAQATGLNKTTISNLIDELSTDGFVREIGRNASTIGRPSVLLELDPDAGWIIGVELGVGHLKVVLTDLCAGVAWREDSETDKTGELSVVLEQLVHQLNHAAEHAKQVGQRILGVGVAIPGLVDVGQGKLIFEPNMGWQHVPLVELLSEQMRLPIFIENDANAAALAERYYGVARGVDNFIYIVANIGLGTGVVIDGHLFRGADGYAGEAGHTTVDPGGPPCRCGNRGCWERMASVRALVERIQQAIQAGEKSVLLSKTNRELEGINLPMILEAASVNDSVVLNALQTTGTYLGIGIANLVNTFNPRLIAFGGSLSLLGEYLLPVARQVVEERAMPELREATTIELSLFKADACVMGAAALVLHDLISRPRLLLESAVPDIIHRHSARSTLIRESQQP
jgi:glucokinase-like ROK family protein